MNRTVFKYPFPRFPEDETTLTIEGPYGTTPRFFAFQHDRPTIWAEVVPGGPGHMKWTIVLIGTGQELPPGNWQYLGSALVAGGTFVFHTYARLEQG